MSLLKCEQCEYKTIRKSNLTRHINTHNKQEKVTDMPYLSRNCHVIVSDLSSTKNFKCLFCTNSFANAGNLHRHKKACDEKNKLKDDYEGKNKYLLEKLNEQIKISEQKDEIIKQKDEIIKQKDETLAIIKSEVAHLKMIVNNSGSIVKTSVSTMAYVIKNFKEAPALELMKDQSAISFEQDNIEFVENLIHESDHNKLHTYIGDFIIKTYKKEDPTKQSIWNSDTSRLTYLIREIMTNNKVDWKIDKKGIKTVKFIIMPILEYIDQQVRDYVENFDIDYHSDSVRIAENKMMKLKSATEIIKNIEDKVLSEEILKYIAPHFYLNRTDEYANC